MGLLLGGHIVQAITALCTAGSSSIPKINDLEIMPANAKGGAKWDSDGGVYYYDTGTTPDENFPASRNGGTWIGSCVNSEYEGRWVQLQGGQFDLPTSSEPAKDVWRAMNLGPIRTEWDKNSGTDVGELQFELRRVSDSVVILTDPWLFDIEAEDPTPK